MLGWVLNLGFAGGGAAPGAIVWTAEGSPWSLFLYTAADYAQKTFAVEIMLSAPTGTGYARLYDKTTDAAVASTQVSSTSASPERKRSSFVSLTNGSEYFMQLGAESGDVASGYGGRIIGR